jgi:hypothetical protein
VGVHSQKAEARGGAPGAGTVNVNIDESNPNTLDSSADSLSYSVTSTSSGKFTIDFQSNLIALGYVISGSKIVFMSADTNPELFIGQQ